MAPLYDGHDYYKRMFELQEKLRKSEEERIRLEERFDVLVRESRNRHDTCINRLRIRYIQYLEEQRTRDERNHKLLAALDKVANKLALINAKKDRLNILRKQYEAHLLRIYANRRPPDSVTGDSGIASQNEDRGPRRSVARPDLAETEGVSSPRAHQAPLQSSQSRSAKFHDPSPVNGTVPNHPASLPTATLDAPLGVDYHRTNVLRTPRVYITPAGQSGDRFVQVPTAPIPDARFYSRPISDYGGNAPNAAGHQDVPGLGVPYTTAPVLPGQLPPDAALIDQLLRRHMESVHTAPCYPTAVRLPTGDAAQNEAVRSLRPRHFAPYTQPFQYRDASVLLPDGRPRIREYDPAEATDAGVASMAGKFSGYPMIPGMNVVDQAGPPPGYVDYTIGSPQKSEDEGSTRSLTSDDVDDLMKRNEQHLLWRNMEVPKSPRRLSTLLAASDANLDENSRTTAILEGELDRYISNIRKLHREHGVPSQEEADPEQNTSGDLLNVTLSEDGQELPAEDKARKELIPEEMGRILALASDLASRTAASREIATERLDRDVSAEVGDEARRRDKRSDAFASGARGRDTTSSEIREDVATHSTELDQPREDARVPRESRNNDDLAGSRVYNQEVPSAKRDAATEEAASLNRGSPVDSPRDATDKKQPDLVTGEQADIDGVFDTAEELAPWDLASVQRNVRELHLDDPKNQGAVEQPTEEAAKIGETLASERVIEKIHTDGEDIDSRSLQDNLLSPEVRTVEPRESETEPLEGGEADARVEKAEPSEISEGDRYQERETEEPITVPRTDEEPGESPGEIEKRKDEEPKARIDDRAEINAEQNGGYEEGYGVEDRSQGLRYEEQQDPSGGYDYGQNVGYEDGAGNEDYERYAEQGYAQESPEYVEYVEGQYEQYSGDPSGQQQYQEDPNAQYEQDPSSQQYREDPNAQYEQDPNQAYDYSYSHQYDPAQGYEGDPNQAYEYPENVPYDPNQTYDGGYEYKDEPRDPEDNVVLVDSGREGGSEAEEASSRKQDSRSERKAEEDEPRQTDSAGQSRKKKDVIKSLLDSDTDTTIERNISNTESDFDFN